MMHNYRIEHGLPEKLTGQAVKIYDEAFGQKLGLMIPNESKRREFLQRVMHPSLCISAIEDENLLGIVGYQTAENSFTGGMLGRGLEIRTAWQLLPPLQALRAWLISLVFQRTARNGELLLDGIAVAPESRGKGVGGALLKRLIEHARVQGYSSVSLKVIDTNPRAYALYLREGFKPIKVEKFECLRKFLGFGAVTTMVNDAPSSTSG